MISVATIRGCLPHGCRLAPQCGIIKGSQPANTAPISACATTSRKSSGCACCTARPNPCCPWGNSPRNITFSPVFPSSLSCLQQSQVAHCCTAGIPRMPDVQHAPCGMLPCDWTRHQVLVKICTLTPISSDPVFLTPILLTPISTDSAEDANLTCQPII